MKRARLNFILAGICLLLFAVLTVLLVTVDVQPVGPLGSRVGLASVNWDFFEGYGSNPVWYAISEGMGVVALLTAAGFGCFGVWQWITRKSLKKVDIDLFALAACYVVLVLIYLLFELVIVNYRPVLMDGFLEASYPSSHTVLVCTIMMTTVFQLKGRVRNKALRRALVLICGLVMILTVIGRLLSGVHWYTDVLAGILLSGTLAYCYFGVTFLLKATK